MKCKKLALIKSGLDKLAKERRYLKYGVIGATEN